MTRRLSADMLPWLLIGAALVVFGAYFIIYNMYAVALFRFPFDYDQGEGFELVDTLLFSRGQWPYRDNNSYPFYSSNYPPVFHLVIVPLVWLFGPHYWTGRVVAYVGTLITAGAIGWAVQRSARRPWLATLCGLAFLASNYIYHVGPLFRQHLFMVMFETLAVVWLTVIIDREEADGRARPRALLGVMILLLLAGYTKQLAYATVIAVFLFLGLRQTGRAVRWAVPFALATGAIFLLINIATNGEWFVATVTANVNPFVPGQAVGLYRQWFTIHLFLTLAAAALVLYELYFDRLSLYAVWFVVAALNGVTAGKWGAGESYFATAIAASCILTGIGAGKLLAWSSRRGRAPQLAVMSLIPLLFLAQADRMFHMPTSHPFWAGVAEALGRPTTTLVAPQTSCSAPRPAVEVPYVDAVPGLLGRPPTAADRAAGERIVNLIAAGDSAAFSEEAAFNLALGRDVVTNPTQLLNLYNNDQVDLTEMIRMLEEQSFDTIVLRAQFYPPPVLDVIGQKYATTDLVEMNGFVYCILRPR